MIIICPKCDNEINTSLITNVMFCRKYIINNEPILDGITFVKELIQKEENVKSYSLSECGVIIYRILGEIYLDIDHVEYTIEQAEKFRKLRAFA